MLLSTLNCLKAVIGDPCLLSGENFRRRRYGAGPEPNGGTPLDGTQRKAR
jgi:hypothetical protein